jgi:membrane fusion protein, multidrug efflux system
MNKGRLTIILAVAVLAGGFALKNFLSEQKAPPPRKNKSTIITVATQTIRNGEIPLVIESTGKLSAYQRIEIYAEVSGTLLPESNRFRAGNRYTKGQVLIHMDDTEARANLIAQKSSFISLLSASLADIKFDYPQAFAKWEKYLKSVDVERPIPALPKTDSEQEKLFLTSRNVYTSFYNIQSAESRLSKYLIVAPFDGMVSESNLLPGTLVRVGQKLGEFIQTGEYELEVSLNIKDMAFLTVGDKVQLRSDEIPGTWEGKVSRVNNRIDPSTQSVQVYIMTRGENLREGMFLTAIISTESVSEAALVSRRLIRPDETIFAIQDSVLFLQPVEVVRYQSGNAIVRGLPNGTVLPLEPILGAHEGMKVTVQ